LEVGFDSTLTVATGKISKFSVLASMNFQEICIYTVVIAPELPTIQYFCYCLGGVAANL
jgi:hypothetical protein